eukprot:756176-Hanusia_phi.AAC.1
MYEPKASRQRLQGGRTGRRSCFPNIHVFTPTSSDRGLTGVSIRGVGGDRRFHPHYLEAISRLKCSPPPGDLEVRGHAVASSEEMMTG